jgi:hypothetical protein
MSDEPEVVEQAPLEPEQVIAAAAEEAEEFKPAKGELVVTPERDVFRAMDRADEIQILEEIQGRALDVMVYSFTPGGGGAKVTDLSYAGVREVVRTLNARGYTRIRISNQEPKMEELMEDGKRFHRVSVYAEDEATGLGQWGVALEPTHMTKRNGDEVWDKFAITKALNKAQRNAMKAVIPVEFQQTIIAQFLGDEKRVRQIQAGPGAEAIAELPPPLDDDLMKDLQQQARERYMVLREMNPLALLPARFHAWVTHSAHDHQRTRDMIAAIEGLIEQEEARRRAQDGGAE